MKKRTGAVPCTALLGLLILVAGCGPLAGSSGEPGPTSFVRVDPETTALLVQPTMLAETLLPRAGVLVVDNADPGFRVVSGEWGECQGNDCGGTPYGAGFRYAEIGCTGCQAEFTVEVETEGEYDLWTWWPYGEDRAEDTPFSFPYAGEGYSISVDQRNSGDGWFWLATLYLPAGHRLPITVGGADSGYANADAVALTPAGSGDPGTPGSAAETPAPAPSRPAAATRLPAAAGSGLVVDYRMADISQIPDAWIERARQLAVHYAHTSHGSQIVTGLEWLAAQDSRYAIAVRYAWDGTGLPDSLDSLRIFDGNPPDDYVTPELYWSTSEGLERTRAVADTGLFALSMWSWCGQQSENDGATVQQYLEELDRLEQDYPAMRFIYMTGHTDGGSETLTRNNDLVRSYAQETGKVLFDFASFELYDPSGRYYPEASDACDWCESWCSEHPEDCRGLDLMGDCAHTHPLQCRLKAEAFWWMMARLAGWDGRP